MTDYRAPVESHRFILNEVLHWERLFSSPEYAHVDAGVGDAVLNAAAEFIGGVLAPTRQIGDEFMSIANGLKPDRFGWLTPVKVTARESVSA